MISVQFSRSVMSYSYLAILFLGIYPKELKSGSQRDICMLMLIAT